MAPRYKSSLILNELMLTPTVCPSLDTRQWMLLGEPSDRELMAMQMEFED